MPSVVGRVETVGEAIRLTIAGSAGLLARGAARPRLAVAESGAVGDEEMGR